LAAGRRFSAGFLKDLAKSTGDSAVIHITLPSGQIPRNAGAQVFDDDDAANDRTLTAVVPLCYTARSTDDGACLCLSLPNLRCARRPMRAHR
jgi:hypothetical protein